MDVIKQVGYLQRQVLRRETKRIDLARFEPGVHSVDGFLFQLSGSQVDWVVSGICDHAHGQL